MATLEINGQQVEVDDSFLSLSPEQQDATVDEIAASLQGNAAGDFASQASQMTQDAGSRVNYDDADRNIRANMEARKLDEMMGPNAFKDASASVDPLMGWGDELWSNTVGAGARMMRDGVGYGEAANREQALQDAMKRRREERSPVATTVGSIAGGLATGGTLAKGGLTLAGKSVPYLGRTAPAALEGATYGAVQGAGDAQSGEKLSGAGRGAAIGGVTAGIMSKGGDMLANRATRKAAANAPRASEVLKAESGALRDAAYTSGTAFTRKASTNLVGNLQLSAGRLNDKLHPQAVGIVQYAQALKNKPMNIEDFHEFRRVVNKAIASASEVDQVPLLRMKSMLDKFAENAKPGDVTGGTAGFDLLKRSNSTYARAMRTEKIEGLSDLAQLKTGNFTQAGEARAISQQAQGLARDILKNGGKGFNPQEVELINKIAMGQTSGKVARNLAKWAPRGVVSGGAGVGVGASLGSLVGGPAGAAIGAATPGAVGYMAAKSVDKAAVTAIRQLEQLVATGKASPALKSQINKLSRLAIPSAVTATGVLSPYLQPQLQPAQR